MSVTLVWLKERHFFFGRRETDVIKQNLSIISVSFWVSESNKNWHQTDKKKLLKSRWIYRIYKLTLLWFICLRVEARKMFKFMGFDNSVTLLHPFISTIHHFYIWPFCCSKPLNYFKVMCAYSCSLTSTCITLFPTNGFQMKYIYILW